MKNKLLILLLLVSSYCLGQSVPNTETFSLQDVYNAVDNHTPATTENLQSCFDNAISAYFNATYNQDSYAPANSMLRFRDYKPNSTQGIIYNATSITSTSATHDCEWDGNGYTMTDGGVVCNTSINPTVTTYAKKVQFPPVIGFTYRTGGITWSGLTPNTTYYARAYMVTSQGTFYSNQVSFTTLP